MPLRILVVETEDGLEVVRKAEERQPRMHGFEVATPTRRHAAHVQLPFIRQKSASDIVRQALKFGAHSFSAESRCNVRHV